MANMCCCILALNIFLSITASLGNALILVALRKESSLHPPTKFLFQCLAVTDICVGLISQTITVISILSIQANAMNWKILDHVDELDNVTSYLLCGVSIFTSTAISVERLLALLLRLRYRHDVTVRRVRAVVICFWLIGAFCGSMHFLNDRISRIVVFVFLILSLVTSTFSYTKIHLTLRQHQASVQDHVHQGQPNGGGIPLNIARYKKTVSSIAWVQLALVVCYVPFAAVILVYLNSSLNPILYCWKIKEVRQAVKDTIKQFCCF
ncbi:melanocortin receptor 4-like [Oculina patagonica]